MSFSFDQWADEQRAHILEMARTPGWVHQARHRAEQLANDWPELFADLPEQRKQATQAELERLKAERSDA